MKQGGKMSKTTANYCFYCGKEIEECFDMDICITGETVFVLNFCSTNCRTKTLAALVNKIL
jgi:hypothetical protein